MTRQAKKSHVAALAVLVLTAACATAPKPDGDIAAAESALEAARSARAADFAPVEFGFARDKLAVARTAMGDRQYDRARAAAEQAMVDAELALAKSRAAQARAEVQGKSEENSALRRDLLGEEGGR